MPGGVDGSGRIGGVDPVDVALARLAPRWAGYWAGLDLAAEATSVRERLDAAVRAWGLDDLAVVPWGEVGLVVTASRGGSDGGAVVVKVSPCGRSSAAELAGEGQALDAWQESGAAVRVLDRRDGGATLLLERLLPGTMLDELCVGVVERLAVLGTLARRLHAAGPGPPGMQPMTAFAEPWRRALAGSPEDVAGLDALCVPTADDVVVHADLHGRNVLRDGQRWVVIDPKGVRGDRHADVWALIDPSVPLLPDDAGAARALARERVGAYARAAGLDPDRAAAWARLRARAVALGVAGAPSPSKDDTAWAVRLHRAADALR